MIDENKLIEHIRKNKYMIFQDNEEHSIEGIIERLKDEDFLEIEKQIENINMQIQELAEEKIKIENKLEGIEEED